MSERMAWHEIRAVYPDQWVKLTEVETDPQNSMEIKSAVVQRIGPPNEEDLLDALQDRCLVLYTTPENHVSVGMAYV